MQKYCAGYFKINNEEEYYTDDFVHFFKSDNSILNKVELEEWAVLINSPWSQSHERFFISVNCKNAYTEMNGNEPIWKCEYSITGCDEIEAGIIGYGNTEIEALSKCKLHFEELQKKYNPNNKSC